MVNTETDKFFAPSKKAECAIEASKLNKEEALVYGDPIFAKTECELFVNYKVPKEQKLEDLALSLWDLSYESLDITEKEPTLIELK